MKKAKIVHFQKKIMNYLLRLYRRDATLSFPIKSFYAKVLRCLNKSLKKAKNKGKTLRFVANITNDECIVGLTEVDKESDIGNLKGPDNFVLFQSKRYDKNPLIIKGPGAGVEVTASGVFADILEARRSIR